MQALSTGNARCNSVGADMLAIITRYVVPNTVYGNAEPINFSVTL